MVFVFMMLAFVGGYLYRGGPDPLPLHIMNFTTQNRAVITTFSSETIWVTGVSNEIEGETRISLSNGDAFVLKEKDSSFDPKNTITLKCSDPILVTPDIMTSHCKGEDYEFTLTWNKQSP